MHLYWYMFACKIFFSSQSDVRDFLLTLNLNRDNYQLGSTKIFLRECEKLKLDYRLHQQIVSSIVTLQRWFRSRIERRRFIRICDAVTTIQVRSFRVVSSSEYINFISRKLSAWIPERLYVTGARTNFTFITR